MLNLPNVKISLRKTKKIAFRNTPKCDSIYLKILILQPLDMIYPTPLPFEPKHNNPNDQTSKYQLLSYKLLTT